tara:strand:+ start:478 stop:597 length:120 start_codon:yes stop_codon:yes gene_type:complete
MHPEKFPELQNVSTGSVNTLVKWQKKWQKNAGERQIEAG